MNLSFLQWWRANAPKGANNSVNAVLMIGLLHQHQRPLSLDEIAHALSCLERQSARTIADFLVADGFLIRTYHNKDNVRRNREVLLALSPDLRARLDKAAPENVVDAKAVLLEHLKLHPEPITTRQLSQATGLSEHRTMKHLNALCDKRVVEAVGRTQAEGPQPQTLYRLAA